MLKTLYAEVDKAKGDRNFALAHNDIFTALKHQERLDLLMAELPPCDGELQLDYTHQELTDEGELQLI